MLDLYTGRIWVESPRELIPQRMKTPKAELRAVSAVTESVQRGCLGMRGHCVHIN